MVKWVHVIELSSLSMINTLISSYHLACFSMFLYGLLSVCSKLSWVRNTLYLMLALVPLKHPTTHLTWHTIYVFVSLPCLCTRTISIYNIQFGGRVLSLREPYQAVQSQGQVLLSGSNWCNRGMHPTTVHVHSKANVVNMGLKLRKG